MERNCEICPNTRFGKHQVASGLTAGKPTCPFKALTASLPEMLLSFPIPEPRSLYV